jgi:anti-sigma regulatory factor (Ser/Thr protein kinase)
MGSSTRQSRPFPRFENRRQAAAGDGWSPVDLGGHEVVSRLHLTLKTGPEAAGEGRHALDRLAGAMPDEQLETLRLLVTELLTNSIRHGTDGDGWIALDVEIYANSVRVAVTDRGPGFDAPENPTPHHDRPGGWGLCLVDRLASRWGVARDQGTRVWFELDRSTRGFAVTA